MTRHNIERMQMKPSNIASLAKHQERLIAKKNEIAAALSAVDEAARMFSPHSHLLAVREIQAQLLRAEQSLMRELQANQRPRNS